MQTTPRNFGAIALIYGVEVADMNGAWKLLALVGVAATILNIAALAVVMVAYYSGAYWSIAYASYGWRH